MTAVTDVKTVRDSVVTDAQTVRDSAVTDDPITVAETTVIAYWSDLKKCRAVLTA
jgi:hypothetical protein